MPQRKKCAGGEIGEVVENISHPLRERGELIRISGDKLHTYFNTHPGVGYKVMERIGLTALAKI
jgi:hypothetical protein